MAQHSVSIRQLTGLNYGKRGPFLNVLEDVYNAIGVWGVCSMPTYLLQKGREFWLIQFGNMESAREWLGENSDGYNVTRLDKG